MFADEDSGDEGEEEEESVGTAGIAGESSAAGTPLRRRFQRRE